MKIFISHSSKDKKVIDCFVTNILILGCGINESDIFCTSVDGLGIRTGDDFRIHIRQNLLKVDYSFLFISNSYKTSDICLNEMGAAWALDNVDVKPFLLPGIGFHSIGTLYSVKQAAKLDDPYALDELFSELTERYKIEKRISRWNKSKEDFLAVFNQVRKSYIDPIHPTPHEFFSEFVQRNANINELLLACHPTLLDCRRIFSQDYYVKSFEIYCKIFVGIHEEPIAPLYPEKKFFKITRLNTSGILSGEDDAPGGMVEAVKYGVFNYNVKFYSVKFLESEETNYGIEYKYFCYVNERWVFIPKPYFKDILKLD